MSSLYIPVPCTCGYVNMCCVLVSTFAGSMRERSKVEPVCCKLSCTLSPHDVKNTVELPNNGHIGSGPFVLYMEVVAETKLIHNQPIYIIIILYQSTHYYDSYTASLIAFAEVTGEKVNRKAGYGLDLSLLQFTVYIDHAR